MTLRSDLTSAAMLLTRLPVRGAPTEPAARAAWAWPLVGLAVGALAGLGGAAVAWLGFSPALAVLVVLALLAILTGALHEDGLADTADGLWGGRDPARRLEIMRDSRIGTYGVIALVLSMLARFLLLSEAFAAGDLIAATMIAAVASRAPLPLLMRWLPPARDDGLASGTGRPPAWAAQAALALGAVALLAAGPAGVVAAVLVLAATLGIGALARARIGGQTGDVLGAVQQLCEIAVLAALTLR